MNNSHITMTNGLDITEAQFMTMNTKEQNLMLFKNVVHIRGQFKDYKFHKKVQYVWLTVLTAIATGMMGIRGWLI